MASGTSGASWSARSRSSRTSTGTFLPYLSQQIQAINPALPNLAQYNFLIFGIILLFMMRFRPQGFIPSRQREAELAVIGLSAAEAEMGIPIDEETPGDRRRKHRGRPARPGRDRSRCAGARSAGRGA